MCLITCNKYRTYNLALHLTIYKNDVFFVKDNISYFKADLPDLSSQFVEDVIQNLFISNQINLCQYNNNWHLKCKSYSKIIKLFFLKDAFIVCTLLGINNNQSIIRIMNAQSSYQCFCISLISTNINKRNNF